MRAAGRRSRSRGEKRRGEGRRRGKIPRPLLLTLHDLGGVGGPYISRWPRDGTPPTGRLEGH